MSENPEDRTGTPPHVCEGCGAVESLGVYHNTETDELSVDCTECGLEYDPGKDERERDQMDAMFGTGWGESTPPEEE